MSEPDEPDAICTMARRFLREGFRGQNMKNELAALYIELAAEDPRAGSDLPETGRAFWKAAEFHYRLWKRSQQSGILRGER